jgi:hypothetical protein
MITNSDYLGGAGRAEAPMYAPFRDEDEDPVAADMLHRSLPDQDADSALVGEGDDYPITHTSKTAPLPTYCTCCCAPLVCHRRSTCVLLSIFFFLFTLSVMFLLFYTVIAPPLVHRFVERATMTCASIGMLQPTGLEFQLAAQCTIHHSDAHGLSGYLEPAVFSVEYDGREFGQVQTQRTWLSGQYESAFQMSAPCQVVGTCHSPLDTRFPL